MGRTQEIVHHALNGGEVSERFDARLDQSKRMTSCARMKNWVPLTLGGAKRRPGTIHVTEAKIVADHPIKRLVAFKASNEAAYIIELGHLYMRFYKDGEPVLTVTGANLITNGTFDTNVNGWTDADTGTGAISQWAAGRMVFTGFFGTAKRFQAVPTTIGTLYRLTFTVTSGILTALVGTTAGGDQLAATAQYGLGTHGIDFTATTISSFIEFSVPPNGSSAVDNVSVEAVGGIVYELVTPWADDELYDVYIPIIQSVDVAYFLHQGHAPRKLSRITPTTFALTEVNFSPPATIQEEPTGDTLGYGTLTPGATTGLGVTFELGGTGLIGSDVGRVIVAGAARAIVVSRVDTNTGTMDIIDAFPSTAPIAAIDWRFTNSPQNSIDITNGKTKAGQSVTVTAQGSIATFTSRMVGMWITAYGGLMQIDRFISGTQVQATIKSDLIDISGDNPVATSAWELEEAAWSATHGYPSSGTFFAERLYLCKGLTINGSVVGDYENFAKGGDADAAISRTISDDDIDPIVWIKGGKSLIVGTGSGAFMARPTSQNGALTQTSFEVDPISSKKAAKIPPLRIDGLIIYVQFGSRNVRELIYDFESDRHKSPKINLLADHLTSKDNRITELAFAEEPDSVIYAMRSDGVLLACVYQVDENVLGWCRLTTNGSFKSLAVIPRTSTGEDWVWVIAERDNGTYIEYFEPESADVVGRDWPEMHTDCASLTTHDANFLVTGLGRFEGQTVRVIGDGKLYNDAVVTGGQFTLAPEYAVSQLEVGLDYDSDGLTLEALIPEELGGPMQTKGYDDIGVRVRRTLGLTIGSEDGNGETLVFRKPTHATDEHVPLQRGKKSVKGLGYDPFGRIRFQQTVPFPAEILNIFARLHVGDRWDDGTEDVPE